MPATTAEGTTRGKTRVGPAEPNAAGAKGEVKVKDTGAGKAAAALAAAPTESPTELFQRLISMASLVKTGRSRGTRGNRWADTM